MHFFESLPDFYWSHSDVLSSLCVLGQCYFGEGFYHHLSDQGNSCRWASLCFSKPFYYLLQFSHQLEVSGQ